MNLSEPFLIYGGGNLRVDLGVVSRPWSEIKRLLLMWLWMDV